MNNGMRYGLVWDLAPRHYSESVDEEVTRPLSRYVAELIRIRTEYKDLLFTGLFRDTLGAVVTGSTEIRYSVFAPKDEKDRRRAVVLVNFGEKDASALVRLQGADHQRIRVVIPFEPERDSPDSEPIHVPAQRCAVVVFGG
jgi:hypothetical protein